MPKFISKTELETQKTNQSEHFVGEIYPEIFSHGKNFDFKEDMPLQTAILYLGAYQLESGLFPKLKCPACEKEEVLIPYLCGGSALTGAHTIQFYCPNCHEKFVTNDFIDYFRQIKSYVIENREILPKSPAFKNCTTLPKNAKFL